MRRDSALMQLTMALPGNKENHRPNIEELPQSANLSQDYNRLDSKSQFVDNTLNRAVILANQSLPLPELNDGEEALVPYKEGRLFAELDSKHDVLNNTI